MDRHVVGDYSASCARGRSCSWRRCVQRLPNPKGNLAQAMREGIQPARGDVASDQDRSTQIVGSVHSGESRPTVGHPANNPNKVNFTKKLLTLRCYDCGSATHLRGDRNCTRYGALAFAPQNFKDKLKRKQRSNNNNDAPFQKRNTNYAPSSGGGGGRDQLQNTGTYAGRAKKDIPCKFHSMGNCKQGSRCGFSHELAKGSGIGKDSSAVRLRQSRVQKFTNHATAMMTKVSGHPSESKEKLSKLMQQAVASHGIYQVNVSMKGEPSKLKNLQTMLTSAPIKKGKKLYSSEGTSRCYDCTTPNSEQVDIENRLEAAQLENQRLKQRMAELQIDHTYSAAGDSTDCNIFMVHVGETGSGTLGVEEMGTDITTTAFNSDWKQVEVNVLEMTERKGGTTHLSAAVDNAAKCSCSDLTGDFLFIDTSEQACNSVRVYGVGGTTVVEGRGPMVLTVHNSAEGGTWVVIDPQGIKLRKNGANTPLRILAANKLEEYGLIIDKKEMPPTSKDDLGAVMTTLRDRRNGSTVPLHVQDGITVIATVEKDARNYANIAVLKLDYLRLLKEGRVTGLLNIKDLDRVVTTAVNGIDIMAETCPYKIHRDFTDMMSDEELEDVNQYIAAGDADAGAESGDDDDLEKLIEEINGDNQQYDGDNDGPSQGLWRLSCHKCSKDLGVQVPGSSCDVECGKCNIKWRYNATGTLRSRMSTKTLSKDPRKAMKPALRHSSGSTLPSLALPELQGNELSQSQWDLNRKEMMSKGRTPHGKKRGRDSAMSTKEHPLISRGKLFRSTTPAGL